MPRGAFQVDDFRDRLESFLSRCHAQCDARSVDLTDELVEMHAKTHNAPNVGIAPLLDFVPLRVVERLWRTANVSVALRLRERYLNVDAFTFCDAFFQAFLKSRMPSSRISYGRRFQGKALALLLCLNALIISPPVRAAEPAEDFGLIGRRVHADLVRLERFRFVWLIVIVALLGLPSSTVGESTVVT
jgi:hypothetical protein